jgi:hypothetical protein
VESAAADNLAAEPTDAEIDWTGKWVCVDNEGMDGLLQELGVGYMQRQMAATMKFGVGKPTFIERSGDVWVAKSPNNTAYWSLEHPVETEEGTVHSEKIENGVYCKQVPTAADKPVVVTRRTLVNGRMVVHFCANSVEATRTFEKEV